MTKQHSLHRLRELQHVVAGVVLALKALSKFESGDLIAGGLLTTLALLIFVYFFFARFGRASWGRFAAFVHLCESAAMSLLTYYYVEEGKAYLPFATFAAAAGYFVAGWMNLRSPRHV